MLVAQGGGLAVEEGLEGAFGEAGGGGVGDLLHHVEVDVESGSVIAERAAGDDFPPLGGELAEFEEFRRSERTPGHEVSCLAVAAKPARGSAPDDLRLPTSHGKAVHDLVLKCGQPTLFPHSLFVKLCACHPGRLLEQSVPK